MIRILAVGDVMGKAGRRCLESELPKARAQYNPDIVIVNGENCAGGFGITRKVYDEFINNLGIDAITTGNHWHDKREVYSFMNEVDRLVLPANMANVDHFRMGFKLLQSKNGVPFAVINLIGKAFMYGENRNPFSTFDQIMKEIPPRYKIIVVDMHAEATSEKQGIGRYATGKASLVYGTHSHVQTADERIIDSKTGFITDIGMTGPYESIIGIRIDAALNRMLTGEKTKFEPATNDPWFCAIVVDIDEESGHCNRIERLRWDSLKASSTC